MKFITTLYDGRDLEFRLMVSPRTRKDADGNYVDMDRMMIHHVSKIGNQSLIFNPRVVITVRPKYWSDGIAPEATIPMHLFYRFVGVLTQVYNNCMDKGVYREDGGLFLDQKGAAAAARRMSLFRYSLTIYPDIMADRDNVQVRAMGFQLDRTKLGSVSMIEVPALIDVLDHMDLATYTVLIGMLEEIDELHTSNGIIINKLTQIEELLRSGLPPSPPPKPEIKEPEQVTMAGFSWVDGELSYGVGN